MRLIADEGIDKPIVERLRQDGHEVTYVAELDAGISDETVLDLSVSSSAMLLTQDKDFGELVFRQNRALSGILLIRLAGLSASSKAEIVSKAIQEHGDQFANGFAVLSEKSLRIRHI